MSVILDALKKAQDERKKPVYRNGGGDEGPPKRTRWIFYVIVGTLACAILFFFFLPNLYRMKAPSVPQVAQQKEVPIPPPIVPPKVVPEAPAGKASGSARQRGVPEVRRDAAAGDAKS